VTSEAEWSFTTAFAVRLLDAQQHQHGANGPTWILYGEAVRIAHEVYKEHHP
jgi:hypothetical protein